ncbi:hypothetical protein IJU97_04970 [bacterium]|nr:hypothetical protein [bacterium]
MDPIETGYNTEVTLPDGSGLSKTGYTFTGWTTTSGSDVADYEG